jgi:hypothetical protein
MKLSKKERKLLKHEIQHGFMRAWLVESGAKKDRQRLEAKSRPLWLTFWRRPIKPVQPVAAVKAASASE